MVSLRRLLSVFLVLALCLVVPFASALPDSGDEKSVAARTPVIPPTPADPTPTAASGEEKEVTARPISLASEPPTPEETVAATSTPDETPTTESTLTVFSATAVAGADTSGDGSRAGDSNDTPGDAETEETATATPTANGTPTTEPTVGVSVTGDDDSDDDSGTGDSNDTSDDEEGVETTPTLAKYAPPRPNATMAKSHLSNDRPLALSDHPFVNSTGPSLTPGENETRAPPAAVTEPRDGLFVKGVGLILDRTPGDVALTRSGVEIANLEWLLDPAMRLAGRHPRAVFEGETFTVTVTIEARNLTVTGESPAHVVLVPPPGETGVYEITRTREPASLRDGERGVWEFSVATRTGRLTVANLTLPEERLVTNLTSNPDLFAFRAYAYAGDQAIPSTGVSDPVLSIRPTGDAGAAEASLPGIYALAGIEASDLRPSETMAGAWERGVDHEAIVAGAVGHLEALRGLGKEDVAAFYAAEGGAGTEEPAASRPSPLDWLLQLFSGLFGGQERAS